MQRAENQNLDLIMRCEVDIRALVEWKVEGRFIADGAARDLYDQTPIGQTDPRAGAGIEPRQFRPAKAYRMSEMISRPTLADPDDDPFLWLEDIEGERATSWVDARSAETVQRFGGPRRDADAAVLASLLDRPDKIPGVTRRGGFLYNLWQDAEHPRGLWRRTTLASYRQPSPDWDVLLDLDALARGEGEDWVYAGSNLEPSQRRRTILRLSRGGSDAVVLREFDLDSRSFPVDGFSAPEAKCSCSWLDPDTLILCSTLAGAPGSAMATRSGYARTVRLWSRGASLAEAPIVFEVDEGSMAAGPGSTGR